MIEQQGKYQQCLPPDIVSEAIGYEAAQVINTINFLNEQPNRAIRVLELGVGTGIALVSLLSRSIASENLVLEGIDIDDNAVTTCQHNIRRLGKENNKIYQPNIQKGDWLQEGLWKKLRRQKYELILFNPPYLPIGTHIRAGYENSPQSTMYTNDKEGLQHYRRVMPELPAILSERLGSTILIRLPIKEGNEFIWQSMRQLISDTLEEIKGIKSSAQKVLQISQNRWGHWLTLTVGSKEVSVPHEDTRILVEMQKRLL